MIGRNLVRALYTILIASFIGSGCGNLKQPISIIEVVRSEEIEDSKPSNQEGTSITGLLRRMPEEAVIGFIDILGKEDTIEIIRTLEDAYHASHLYIERNGVSPNTIEYSFKQIHDGRVYLDCSELTMIAAAGLSDNGYRPLELIMMGNLDDVIASGERLSVPVSNSEDPRKESYDADHQTVEEYEAGLLEESDRIFAHSVFLYKEDGKFGYFDFNDFNEDRFENVSDLVKHVSETRNMPYTHFFVWDISTRGTNWINDLGGILVWDSKDMERVSE